MINEVLIFKIFMENSSYSKEFLDCNELMIFPFYYICIISFFKYFHHYFYIILYFVSLNITIIRNVLIDPLSNP